MSVDKVILRAFLSTLAAVGVLILFMFAALCTFYPSTMMGLTYDLGMESSSIHFAERAYKDSDDIYYIAYATEVAIGEGNDKKIDSCGERFIADKGFKPYCDARNEELAESVSGTYEQYVYGQVCVAKYNLHNADAAIERAFILNGNGFTENNAVVAVLISALKAEDTVTVEKIKGRMEQMQESVPEADKAYFGQILALTNG